MQRLVTCELIDDKAIISDPKSGSRLYNRGLYGTPISGGGLELELLEAFYLLESGKLRIFKKKHELNVKELLTYITKMEPTFEIKYIVYRDLRLRGHVVKQSKVTDFVIYSSIAGDSSQSGKRQGKRQIKYWSQAVSERAQFDISEISDLITTAKNTRKNLLISLVDEEGDLTYYSVSTVEPKGKQRSTRLKYKIPGSALLVEDRVVLWDTELISELRSVGFYGKIVGSSLQLALTESAYLINKGVLEVQLARTKRKLDLKQFLRIARKIQPDIDRRLLVYRELKRRKLIVKTGFKYGTHFRVYEGDPESEHSEFLVHGVPKDFKCSWEEISRAVRLAHGVRKHMLFGRILEQMDQIEYINIERIKP